MHIFCESESVSCSACPTLCNPMDCCKTALSVGFLRQDCWNGLPFPSPGDLPDPRIKPGSAAV